MADEHLKGVNWESSIDLDDLKFDQEQREADFLDRLKLVFGTYLQNMTVGWGIVDENDPDLVVTTDDRPLVVRANTTNPLQLDVLAGMAVTSDAFIINVAAPVENIDLALTTTNSINVVYVEYQTELINKKLTRYNTLVGSRRVVVDDEDLIDVVSLDDFQNTSIFNAERMTRVVALAVVTMIETSTGQELSIDLSKDIYSWNRPWFSPIDIWHRQKLGTGTQTEQNTHAIGANDLTAAGLTFMQLLTQNGMIVSRDQSMPMVPGQVEIEIFSTVEIQTDDASGTVTGVPNADYVELNHYPVRLGACVEDSNFSNHFAGNITPNTAIVWFDPGEDLTNREGLIVVYAKVDAGEPPVHVGETSLTFQQPVEDEELIIADGLAFNNIEDATVSFEDAGQLPRRMQVVGKSSDGGFVLEKLPQVLLPQTLADNLASEYDINTAMIGDARLRVWMTQAIDPAPVTLVVDVVLQGKDTTGAALTETINFDSTWSDSPVPSVIENDSQYKLAANLFSELTNVKVTNRVDDGPDTEILVEALIEPVTTKSLDDMLPLTEIFWDGLRVWEAKDVRPINRIAQKPTRYHNAQAVEEAIQFGGSMSPIAFSAEVLAVEDLNDTYFNNLLVQDSPYGGATTGASTRLLKTADGLTQNDVPPTFDGTNIVRGVYWSRAILVDGNFSQFEVIPLGAENIGSISWRYTLKADPLTWIPAPVGNLIQMNAIIENPATHRWVADAGAGNNIFKVEIRIEGEMTGVILMAHNGSVSSIVVPGDIEVYGCVVTDCIRNLTPGPGGQIEMYTDDASDLYFNAGGGSGWGDIIFKATNIQLMGPEALGVRQNTFDVPATAAAVIKLDNSTGGAPFVIYFTSNNTEGVLRSDPGVPIIINPQNADFRVDTEERAIFQFDNASNRFVDILNVGGGRSGLRMDDGDLDTELRIRKHATSNSTYMALVDGTAGNTATRFSFNNPLLGTLGGLVEVESEGGFACGSALDGQAGNRVLWDVVYGTLAGGGLENIGYSPAWSTLTHDLVCIASIRTAGYWNNPNPTHVGVGISQFAGAGNFAFGSIRAGFDEAISQILLEYDTITGYFSPGDRYSVIVFYVPRF
jgi:hypothetical protein